LSGIEGIGAKTAELLAAAGFAEPARLAAATAEELTAIEGIGAKTAVKIIASAKKHVEEPPAAPEPAPAAQSGPEGGDGAAS
jgi:predicted flap endonuclease-1-like 5' DNA nuclease